MGISYFYQPRHIGPIYEGASGQSSPSLSHLPTESILILAELKVYWSILLKVGQYYLQLLSWPVGMMGWVNPTGWRRRKQTARHTYRQQASQSERQTGRQTKTDRDKQRQTNKQKQSDWRKTHRKYKGTEDRQTDRSPTFLPTLWLCRFVIIPFVFLVLVPLCTHCHSTNDWLKAIP